ncbi:sterile alpha motif domain-containing protein 9-like isoform 2-T3 [Pholidichthys leucotaenia]
MARRALSTAGGGEIGIGSEIINSFSLLEILHANQFEGEVFDQKLIEQTEENFYRGAPPNWLNFYISEQAESNGTGTSFIKRDGYETLKKQISQRGKGLGTSAIELFHQQGCGGTTLTMQMLWDLRKTFRCAVLTGSTSDIVKVAKEVVHLFTAGNRDSNTVLLLINDDFLSYNLQDSIMEEIAEQEIAIDMPVVILLNCVRVSDVVMSKKEQASTEQLKGKASKRIILKRSLSDTEEEQLVKKKEELSRRFGDRCKQFHGFNILQTNFSQDYIQDVCAVFKKAKRANKPLKAQLAAFLSLLNAYVPGSYLQESQCLDFLQHDNPVYGNCSIEHYMNPFGHLIVTFHQDINDERKVSMAHPLIAQCCTELLAIAGVTRSDTARNFLTNFCRDQPPPCLLGFVKDLLTKREMKKEGTSITEQKELFSRLILDITKKEGTIQSASILKVASKKFDQNPFFPQALARFCSKEQNNFDEAEKWAKTAIKRDPQNSYVADTLGQVHKNNLIYLKDKKVPTKPRKILQLAKKAINAFEEEKRLAENEHWNEKKGDGKTKVLRALNTRGQFGYLEVCNLLYDHLVGLDEIWKKLLTKNESLGIVLRFLGDTKLFGFDSLIKSLRDKVEKNFEFFDTFLTYSTSNKKNDDASYVSKKAAECYKKYIGDSAPDDKLKQTLHKLRQKLAVTSAGVLSCINRCTSADAENIATWWEEVYRSKDLPTEAFSNYIFAKIMLTNMEGILSSSDNQSDFRQKMSLATEMKPEFHMLKLLVFWPTDDEDKQDTDLHQLIKNVQHSYEQEFKTLFQDRYLLPLFFFGKGEGLNRFVHRRTVEIWWTQDALKDANTNWKNENIFKDTVVQEKLLKVEGVVRNYKLYATFRETETEIHANRRDSLWKSGKVSFYLGFTINGPLAFSIQRTTTEGPPRKLLGASGNETESSEWTKLEPEVTIMDEVYTYSLHCEKGLYECSLSALRWVCEGRVSFSYRFRSWDEHVNKPVCINHIPAGPLMDITVTAGKMEEVHLPHWFCIDKNVSRSDAFVVLHVDADGDFVEQVSEVTPSHVKLNKPVFSPKGAMILKKLGFKVKIFFDVLIYMRIRTKLMLHVYPMTRDPALQQAVETEEKDNGFRRIRKPSPTKPLRRNSDVSLSADTDGATIRPDNRTLTCTWSTQNFFEVEIDKSESEFSLILKDKQKGTMENVVWSCTILTDDIETKNINNEEGKHFVDRHRTALIERVNEISPILDSLLDKQLISQDKYDYIRNKIVFPTSRDQMREIVDMMRLEKQSKDTLYEILKERETLRYLMSDLEGSK